MKKLLWILVGIIVIGGLFYWNQPNKTTNGKRNVYTVLPLTGSLSYVGQEAKKAVEAHTNANNNLFNIVFIDSHSQTSDALTGLLPKIANEQNPIILSILTSATSAILSGIPKNAFVFGDYITSIEGEYKNYQLLTGELNEVMIPIKQYLQTTPIKTISVVYIEDDFGLLEKTYLEKNIRKDQKILTVLPLSPKSFDTRIEATKLIKENPDAICILGIATVAYTNMIQSLKELGYKGTIIADYAFANPHVAKNLQDNANGVITVTTITDTNTKLSPDNQKVKDNLQKAGLRAYALPIQIWDTLDLIQYSLENNLELSQETYTKMGQWNGISGKVQFPGNGHSLYPFVLVKYQNGEFIPLESEIK